jgi:U3 small nucleolar RNA-associated protein 14
MSPVDSQTLSVSQSQVTQQPSSDHNPWLSRNGPPQNTALKKSEVAVSKDSTSAVKAKNKLLKKRRETKDEVTKGQDDGIVEISSADLLVASFKNGRQLQLGEESSGGDSEVDEQEQKLKQKGKHSGKTYHAFQQRELVTRAFAGDNVVEVCGKFVSIWGYS